MTRRLRARRALMRNGRLASPQPPDGIAIDAWYSDEFLSRHAGVIGLVQGDLAGRVLEVRVPGARLSPLAARLGPDRVVGSVTRIDLSEVLGDGRRLVDFDAVACPLSLQFAPRITDAVAVIAGCARPGGVVLATIPSIGPQSSANAEWPLRWQMTPLGARRVFEECFPADSVMVETFGNVLTATAHLYGLSATTLRGRERE
jgi:hypothetical protein